MLISNDRQLKMLCEQLEEAVRPRGDGDESGAPLAFDTEFVSERRYTPLLCLLQIYCPAQPFPIEAAIDPLAVDIRPLVDLIADDAVAKIVHAGSSDLQILHAQFGCRARNVFDTQIAGAFLGYGHQAGYADLVRRVADGPTLSKAQQFTDWQARPLSPSQVAYALDDVRYLPLMHDKLLGALAARGRLRWANAEFERACERATEVPEPNELWRKFNLSGLSRRQVGTLRELAATREIIARENNKPPSFIVPDLTLLQMSKLPPADAGALRSLRGMPSTSFETTRLLLEAVARASKLTDDELPALHHGARPDPQAEVVSGLLNVVTQLRADDLEISRSYLAPRDQLNALASWWLKSDSSAPPDLPVLKDWRRELLGDELVALLEGRLAISLDGKRRGQSARALREDNVGSVVQIVPTRRDS
jgi:ribonuclease D